jgi:hypothetical protein
MGVMACVRCVLIVLSGMLGVSTFACDCSSMPSVADALIRSDLVFSGRVISADTLTVKSRGSLSKRAMVRYGIVLEQLFKGEGADTVFVVSGTNSLDCGYPFILGGQYVLYTSKFDVDMIGSGSFTAQNVTSVCTRTRPFDTGEIQALGRSVQHERP